MDDVGQDWCGQRRRKQEATREGDKSIHLGAF
jgi:hypothetical protein